jgi:hypothetical protein
MTSAKGHSQLPPYCAVGSCCSANREGVAPAWTRVSNSSSSTWMRPAPLLRSSSTIWVSVTVVTITFEATHSARAPPWNLGEIRVEGLAERADNMPLAPAKQLHTVRRRYHVSSTRIPDPVGAR